MSSLTAAEIMLITELVEYPRGAGYVLDLSDRTIRDFFAELGIDIDSLAYTKNGTSKGNRVRTLLKATDDTNAAIILNKLGSTVPTFWRALGMPIPCRILKVAS